jgi:hypothetical protein
MHSRNVVPALIFLLAALLTAPAASAQQDHAGQALALLDAQKCDEAVEAVNDGMRADEPRAHFIAGQMFQNGYCLVANVPRALRIYARGALLGDRDAARLLALVHARGDGVPQSYPEAARWYAVMRRKETGIAAPPVDGFEAPDIVVRTYIDAVHDLAVQQLVYPRDAIDKGVTGTVRVSFDPRTGSVRLLASTDNVGSPTIEPNRHDFERALFAGYAEAIRSLPRPSMSPHVDNSTERQVVFDRKIARPDQPGGLQMLAR